MPSPLEKVRSENNKKAYQVKLNTVMLDDPYSRTILLFNAFSII